MKIFLTPEQRKKKDKGLCIVNGCDKSYGKGMNICHSHKVQRVKNNQVTDDPIKLAYNEYCKSQLKYELPAILFKKFKKDHRLVPA